MPTNSNASLRYRILDRCFSSTHHKYTIDDLLDIVNEKLGDKEGRSISIRQLRKDIQDMRDRVMYDAPITAIRWRPENVIIDIQIRIFQSLITNYLQKKLKTSRLQ